MGLNISTTDYCILIDEWIATALYRQIMKRKLIDGATYEQIAEECKMSVRGVKYIVKRCKDELNKHI